MSTSRDNNTVEFPFNIFYTDTTGPTGATAIHIYDVTGADLEKIVSAYVNCNIGDGEHDLQRTGDQTNPLVRYCDRYKNNPSLIGRGYSYINGTFVSFTYNYDGVCTSQPAIKKSIEKSLHDKQFGNRLPLERKSVSIEKSLQTLQQYLVKSDNGFGRVGSSVVETHRGGAAVHDNTAEHSIMYKSELTTTFDLGSQVDFIPLTIGEIVDYSDIENKKIEYRKNSKTLKTHGLPVLRFYPNYFPNAFSVFIKGEKFIFGEIWNKILPYFQGNQNFVNNLFQLQHHCKTQLENLIASTKSTITFEPKSILLLHMFTQIDTDQHGGVTMWPTFSLQYAQVIADDVTMQLYGERKRAVVGCCAGMKDFKPKGIVFADSMPFEMKCCHTLYGKTCGDGVTIEAANMFSYIHQQTTNVLSSDFCCNLHASYVTGFSTNQAQTKTAGTGFGFLSLNRNVEFFQSAPVSGGKSLGQIYAENITNNYNKHRFNEAKMKELLNNELRLDTSIFLDYCVDKFINKKIKELGGFLGECSKLIQIIKDVLHNRLSHEDITQQHKDLFEKVGRFNFSTIGAEVDEYRSSFQKIIASFNGFYKIGSSENKNRIEDGISYISSIEEKLKECGFESVESEFQHNEVGSPIRNTSYTGNEGMNNKLENSSYKEIVFVFLSTFLSGIGTQKITDYEKLIVEDINKIEIIKKHMKGISESMKSMKGISDSSKTEYFYKQLLDIYNKRGIHKIEPENKLYPYKCQLKQRINLLKFILRFKLFSNSFKSYKKTISKPITAKSKLDVLNSKLKLVNYDDLQNKYESPLKTPITIKRLKTNECAKSITILDPIDDEDMGQVLPPIEDNDIDTENKFVRESFFGNIISCLYSFFEEKAPKQKKQVKPQEVQVQPEEVQVQLRAQLRAQLREQLQEVQAKLPQELPELQQLQKYKKVLQEGQAQLQAQLQEGQAVLRQLELSIQQLQAQEVVVQPQEVLVQLQAQLQQLQKHKKDLKELQAQIQAELQEVQAGLQEVQAKEVQAAQLGEVVQLQTSGPLSDLTEFFYNIFFNNPTQQEKNGTTVVLGTKRNSGLFGGAGSRKNLHKKTKKVTRRKNKKSPKRKTIKKRKMPKRKNKTRRNK